MGASAAGGPNHGEVHPGQEDPAADAGGPVRGEPLPHRQLLHPPGRRDRALPQPQQLLLRELPQQGPLGLEK